MSRLKDMRGFTLVELMITIALLAIVATIAVPNFVQFIRNNQVQAKADELKTFLQYARGQAVTTRKKYEITTGTDWEVKEIQPNASRVVKRKLEFNAAQAQPATNPSSLTLTFTANGMASPTAKITICRDIDFANGYLLEIKPSGVVKMYARGYQDDTTKLTSCAP
ncbi:MAG TPA: pilus assembly protein FimT [Pseudomonas sp.]|nr:pilus assembly protein FimT [Pseudomonas sp.]